MQAASDATDGSMVSVIGLKSDKVQDICDAAAKQSGEPVQVNARAGPLLTCELPGINNRILWNQSWKDSQSGSDSAPPSSLRSHRVISSQIANFLCNGNYAVSGSSKACDVVEQIAKPDFKARMTVRLAVAGAFHTDFMEAAVDKVKGDPCACASCLALIFSMTVFFCPCRLVCLVKKK